MDHVVFEGAHGVASTSGSCPRPMFSLALFSCFLPVSVLTFPPSSLFIAGRHLFVHPLIIASQRTQW